MSAEEDLQKKDEKEEKSGEKPDDKSSEKDEKQKEKKPMTLKEFAKEYELKKKNGVYIPEYFTRKERYPDPTEEKVAIFQAQNFFLGIDIFTEQGSCSAKITYVGPNPRYTLRGVLIGKRTLAPAKSNWKVWSSQIFMWKRREAQHKIKDPKFIRDALTSRGGKANFKIRFVQDKDFQVEEVKKKVFAKDPNRLMRLPYRIKKDQAKLGVKPVFQDKDEAKLLLSDLGKEMKASKLNKDILEYVKGEIQRFEKFEKKMAAQAKKD